MKLFVGNIDFEVTDRELRDLFILHAGVKEAFVVRDREGRGKGFGFIELMAEEEAEIAIKALHGTPLRGRAIRVEIAKPRSAEGDRRNKRRAA